MRREWIEIIWLTVALVTPRSSPSMRREWIEIACAVGTGSDSGSPSMRREWIEMQSFQTLFL